MGHRDVGEDTRNKGRKLIRNFRNILTEMGGDGSFRNWTTEFRAGHDREKYNLTVLSRRPFVSPCRPTGGGRGGGG